MDNDRANLLLVASVGLLLVLVIVVLVAGALSSNRKSAAEQAAAPAEAAPVVAAPATETPVATAALAAPAATTPTPPPAPKPAAEGPKTLPEQMSRQLSGSRQIIVITGARLGSNSGDLAVYNLDGGRWTEVLKTPANFGKNGLVDGETRTSGHLETPTGIWWIGGFLFGQHSAAPTGTKMAYRGITQDSWWSSVRDSTYNSWVESSSHVDGEHLADAKVQYEYAFDTGYNSLPNERVFGRGTAIFIHCFEPAGNSLGPYTHGCVAIDRAMMMKLFTVLDPARKPSCVVGTLQKGSRTSVYAY